MRVTRRVIDRPANAPPPREIARNAFLAAGRVAKALVTRQPIKRTEAEREAALATCHGCDRWTGSTCGVCGCFGRFKTWLETEKCPLGKW